MDPNHGEKGILEDSQSNEVEDCEETRGLYFIRAMALYESEARPFLNSCPSEGLRAIARRWGSAVGLGAAEAFESVRSVR